MYPSAINDMFSNRNGLLSLWKFPPSTRIGKWSKSNLWSCLWQIFGICSSQSEDRRNLSSLECEATSLELDQVNVPPSKGKSIRPCSEIKGWFALRVHVQIICAFSFFFFFKPTPIASVVKSVSGERLGAQVGRSMYLYVLFYYLFVVVKS